MGSGALTLEVTGDEGKLQACTQALREYGILEIAGSGSVALGRAGFGGGEEMGKRRGPAGKYNLDVLMAGGEVSRSAV
jgi:hypothetical protein